MFNQIEKNNDLPDVLLVENDKASRDIIRYFLRKICNVDFAENGNEALKKVTLVKYSAVLMDINLGLGISGVETAQNIRKVPGYNEIPIAAITAYAMAGDKEKFLSLGCTHYLAKPFDKEDLQDLVQEIIAIQ